MRRSRRLREAPEAWRDWAGLPEVLLEKVAGKLVAQTEAGFEAWLKRWGFSKAEVQEKMVDREREGNCLFVFAMVCKKWRKAQLKVGGPLRSRVDSDVFLPGRMALVKWAVAEGCLEEIDGSTMVHGTARYGHLKLAKWLCKEQQGSFPMDEEVMEFAAKSANLELVEWLRVNGCPWDKWTCYYAVESGRVEVLRWAREHGCEWDAATRRLARRKLGYTDDLGNLEGEEDYYDAAAGLAAEWALAPGAAVWGTVATLMPSACSGLLPALVASACIGQLAALVLLRDLRDAV